MDYKPDLVKLSRNKDTFLKNRTYYSKVETLEKLRAKKESKTPEKVVYKENAAGFKLEKIVKKKLKIPKKVLKVQN